MAVLPPLLVPGAPPFQQEGYGFQPMPIFGDAPMVTGAARRRRTYLSAPSTVDVGLELRETQKDAFVTWYEGPLKAGGEFFSARIAVPGSGLLWFKSRFIGPPKYDFLGGLWWKITAKLMVFGDGTVDSPTTSVLSGGVLFDLLGDAAVSATQPLAGGVTFNLIDGTSGNYITGGVGFDLTGGTYMPPTVGVGAAAGSSTATALAQAVAVGNAAGSSTASAFVPGSAVGSAAGTSTAQAVSTSSGLFFPNAGATWVSGSALTVPITDVPFYAKRARVIKGVSVLTIGGPGSCVIDIWKAAAGGYPPVLGGSICAAAKPTIAAGITYFDTTLIGWTKNIAAGETLLFHLVSTSSFTLIKIVLHFEEST